MPYIVPKLASIRDDLLRDIKNLLPDADVSEDSDFYVRATSVASAVEGLYQHQSWIVRQIFPDTADTEFLELHAAVRGLRRKAATAASGFARILGTLGQAVGVGQILLAPGSGQRYVVKEVGAIGEDGTVVLAATAEAVGVAGNAADDTPVRLQPAPAGLEADAVLLSMRGGTERETDTELLARLLDVIRRPPAGGNKYDYRRWALEVPGVTAAYVFPLRRGLGTVDVVVISGDGLPSEATLDAVRDHIDDVRPVTGKDFVVTAPVIRMIDLGVLVALQGVLLDEARPSISAALNDQFAAIEPGQGWIRSHAEALISNVPGVVDRSIPNPAGNVAAEVTEDVVEWLRLGDLAVDLMP